MLILSVGVGEWFRVQIQIDSHACNGLIPRSDCFILSAYHIHGSVNEIAVSYMCGSPFSIQVVMFRNRGSAFNMPVTELRQFQLDVTTLTAFVDWEGVYAFSAFGAFDAHDLIHHATAKKIIANAVRCRTNFQLYTYSNISQIP
jgi:hypothetical protein